MTYLHLALYWILGASILILIAGAANYILTHTY